MDIAHRIERTKNRHSRAVLRNDIIVIRLAKNLSETEEHRHIDSLLHRMRKAVVRERKKSVIDPFAELLNGAQSAWIRPVSGSPCLFSLEPGEGRTRASRTPDGWKVSVGHRTTRSTLHRFLWSLLSDSSLPVFRSIVETLNAETFRVRIRTVRCRFMRTQWGSCSRENSITLNTTLLFCPPNLLRYVVLHELAHCRIRSHSAAYWRELERFCPTVKEDRKILRNLRLPSL